MPCFTLCLDAPQLVERPLVRLPPKTETVFPHSHRHNHRILELTVRSLRMTQSLPNVFPEISFRFPCGLVDFGVAISLLIGKWLEPLSVLITPRRLVYFSMKLSLVTGTYNRPRQCIRLIESVLEHTTIPFEMVISEVGPLQLQVDVPQHIRFIPEPVRLGHSAGYNAAFKQCRGEFVLWLNDDSEVTPGYDVEAINFMETHPQIGLGALHYSENGDEFHWNAAWSCGYANFGILRKSLGDKVGWFDTDLKMYGADNSLAIRVLLDDCGIADIPRARILHHSENDQVRTDNQLNRLRDNKILHNKYMPMSRQWQRTYQRYKCESTQPWAHGVKPQAVTA